MRIKFPIQGGRARKRGGQFAKRGGKNSIRGGEFPKRGGQMGIRSMKKAKRSVTAAGFEGDGAKHFSTFQPPLSGVGALPCGGRRSSLYGRLISLVRGFGFPCTRKGVFPDGVGVLPQRGVSLPPTEGLGSPNGADVAG